MALFRYFNEYTAKKKLNKEIGKSKVANIFIMYEEMNELQTCEVSIPIKY